jgi:K+-sensing histidine kinase KdpD
LDGIDISKAIIDYATSNTVTDIVVGASTKNMFIRYMALACSFVLDHTNVAIKILRPDASQGRKQFQQEVLIEI